MTIGIFYGCLEGGRPRVLVIFTIILTNYGQLSILGNSHAYFSGADLERGAGPGLDKVGF